MATLLFELLPALRRERSWSQNDLSHATVRVGDEGVSVATIQSYEKPSRAGVVPEVEILDALGRALGVDPAETFYEYPLAAARRAARPGVSHRRSASKQSETLEEVADRAARQRAGKQPKRAASGPGRPRKGRAA